jgi:hypothetical protein
MDDFDIERARRLCKTLTIISLLMPVGGVAAAFLGAIAATRLGYGATGQAMIGGAGIVLVADLRSDSRFRSGSSGGHPAHVVRRGDGLGQSARGEPERRPVGKSPPRRRRGYVLQRAVKADQGILHHIIGLLPASHAGKPRSILRVSRWTRSRATQQRLASRTVSPAEAIDPTLDHVCPIVLGQSSVPSIRRALVDDAGSGTPTS